LLLSLVPFTNVSCEFEKKILRLTPQNFVLRTAPAEGLPHRALSSVGLRFGFFGHFATEGTEVISASVTKPRYFMFTLQLFFRSAGIL